MVRSYGLGSFRKAFNAVSKLALRLRVPFPGAYILTTVGRKTGKERSTPVLLIKDAERRHLVAASGVVGWVHNALAARTVRITRGRRHDSEVRIEELSPEQAPILRKYVRKALVVLPYFDAGRNAPLEAFVEKRARIRCSAWIPEPVRTARFRTEEVAVAGPTLDREGAFRSRRVVPLPGVGRVGGTLGVVSRTSCRPTMDDDGS